MDELEKKPDAPQESAEKKPERKNDFDNRRKLMYVLCGGYLIYLAIKMGRDYPGLAASGVWSSDRITALCGAIAVFHHRRGSAGDHCSPERARVEAGRAERTGGTHG